MDTCKSIRLIRNANYRVFWIGQGVSWFGSVMQSVAQGWLVWSLTRSPAQLALTAVMLSLPVLIFSMLGGVSADRFDRRAMLVITQGGSIVPSLFLGILAVRGEATVAAVMLLAFFQGVLNAFDAPARHALLPELVAHEQLGQAVACNAVSFNATRLLGPAAAGCVIASFGVAPCFFINASSFVAGAVSLLFVRLPYRRPEHPLRRQTLLAAELREGVRFVLGCREIALLLTSVLLVSLLAIPFVPLLPVFADHLGTGPRGLGAMSACLGGGSLLAALWLACSADFPQRHDGHLLPGMLFSLSLLLFAGSADYRLSQTALFMAGAAVVIFLTRVNRRLQQSCPERLRGRVMGAYTLALLGAAPIGSAIVGLIAAWVGAPLALAMTSSTCLLGLGILEIGAHPCRTSPATPWGTTLAGSDGAHDL